MAVTVNSYVDGGRQPSAPVMGGSINIDADASYPEDGYDVSSSLPPGVTILHSDYVINYDGAALRYCRLASVNGTVRAKFYAQTDGAPGAEVSAATNLAGHTGLDIGWIGW